MAEEKDLSVDPEIAHVRASDLSVDPEIAHVRAEIEHTRFQLGDTLDAIQEKLSPERLKAQARESIRDATIGRVEKMARRVGLQSGQAGRGIMDIARENPLPLALLGLGAGWLFFNARRKGRAHAREFDASGERAPIGYEAAFPDGRAHRLHDAADSALHHVTDLASDVSHKAGTVAHDVAAGLHRTEERAHDRLVQTRVQYDETPWIGGALALTLGAAAGLALPSTEREDELFGEQRDELIGRASDAGHDKLDASARVAREVIEDTRESVQEHAREEGLA